MEVRCPSCQSTFPGLEGLLQTCPACMHSFELVLDSSAVTIPPLMKLQLQGPLGEALGTYDIFQLKQMVYAGELHGKELMRAPGGDWAPIYDQPQLTSVFELVGLDLVAIRLSTQKVKGWQKDASAKKTGPKKQRVPASAQDGSGTSREFSGVEDQKASLPTWAPVALAVVAVVVLLSFLL